MKEALKFLNKPLTIKWYLLTTGYTTKVYSTKRRYLLTIEMLLKNPTKVKLSTETLSLCLRNLVSSSCFPLPTIE